MISFFSNRKPKQFNYKPRYEGNKDRKKNPESISFRKKKYSGEMYGRYDRIPFADLKKAGIQRMKIKAIVLAIIIVILILFVDKIEEFLKELS